MNMAPREVIWAAFYALVGATADYVTKSRIPKHWDMVSSDQMPALFMVQKAEDITTAGIKQRRKHVLSGDLYVYVFSGDPTISAASLLNPLVDAAEAAIYGPQPAIKPQQLIIPGYPLGVIQEARVVGKIETDEGTLGQKAVAIIPFELIASD